MKIYQNNKLVATLEKTGACLGENKETGKIGMLGNLWELKGDRKNLIDNLITPFEVKDLDKELLIIIFKRFKKQLDLSNKKLVAIAENPNELTEQEIVFYISTKEQSPQWKSITKNKNV